MSMELLAKLFAEESYSVVVLLLFFYSLLNANKILDFYYNLKRKKIEVLLDAVNNQHISDDLKKHLLQQLDLEYFYITHRVRVSYPMLNAILTLALKVGDSVSFRHLLHIARIGVDLTKVTDNDYRVKLSSFDRALCIYSLLSGLFIVLFGFLNLLILVDSFWKDFNAGALIQTAIFIPLGMFFMTDFIPIVSAKHINKALNEVG